MLTQLRRPGEERAPGGLVDLLMTCHARIRRFSALAVELARADVHPAELAAAARSVHRYFTIGLPLHVADEDDSLLPRLLAAGPPPELHAAVLAMAAEHKTIVGLIDEVVPRWSEVAEAPKSRAAHRDALAALGGALLTALEEHLRGEESIVFPALLTLDQDAIAAIRLEMSRRRATTPVTSGGAR